MRARGKSWGRSSDNGSDDNGEDDILVKLLETFRAAVNNLLQQITRPTGAPVSRITQMRARWKYIFVLLQAS